MALGSIAATSEVVGKCCCTSIPGEMISRNLRDVACIHPQHSASQAAIMLAEPLASSSDTPQQDPRPLPRFPAPARTGEQAIFSVLTRAALMLPRRGQLSSGYGGWRLPVGT